MTASPLTAEQAGFLGGPVSITVSSRDARRVPSVMKAVGCRVSADRREVTLLLEAEGARQLLNDIAATRQVAAVFSLPSTHRTLQIKGSDARTGALQPTDSALIEQHAQAFAADIIPLGYAREFALALHGVAPSAQCVAVTFTVEAVYAQTPGPGAGARIGGTS
ncbi:MAG: hypothetical protein ACOY3X_09610 [Pseudomonadota bacterium]